MADTAFLTMFLFYPSSKPKNLCSNITKKQYIRYPVLRDDVCVQQYVKSEDWVLGTFKTLVKYITFFKKK